MNKFLFSLLFAGLIGGCNTKEPAGAAEPSTNDTAAVSNSVAAPPAGTPAPPKDAEARAVEELCPCVNTSLADMSPKVRRIIVDAGKSASPVEVLNAELQKIGGASEQNRLERELERFQYDPVLQGCSENLKKKYQFDENDPATREKLMKAAEQNKDCELVYALMRIAAEHEKQMRQPAQ